MGAAADILAGLAGLALGAVVGLAAGRIVRARRDAWFWVAGVAILLSGIAAAAWADVTGVSAAWIAALGAIAGGLTALKYGAARTPVSRSRQSEHRQEPGWERAEDSEPQDRRITRH